MTLSFLKKPISLPLAALAATLAMGAPQAGAQNFFDILFGGGNNRNYRQPQGEFPPPPRKTPPKRAAPAKISAPSYYTYKTDQMVPVDFSKLVPTTQSVSLEPSLAGTAFREALAGLSDFNLVAEKEIAKALLDYYSANPDFIWVTGQVANSRAEDAIRSLSDAAGHGLMPADYSVAVPQAAFATDDTAGRLKTLIRFEMAMSARALRYVHDAQGGRIDPNRISGYYDFAAKPLDMVGVLKSLSQSQDARALLEGYHPKNPEYQALRVELEALRASEENDIVVDAKLLLKPGETSPELPKLLHLIARGLDDEMGGEYGETLARLGASEIYVPELVPVIEAVQKRAGLKPDGVVGPRTVATLAGTSKADRLDKVLVALEQLRWLPSDLGSPRVFINQPAYTASYIDGGVEKLKMKTVIGKTTNQTSFFQDEIEQVDYNPYWGVPQSIIVNEMLPRLRNDPSYLDRAGYEVTDSRGKRIPSSAIDWGQYGAKVPFSVRQAPSEANALGELKILFPNKHAIYMHDTPQKALFDRDSRAFSHGCIRLSDPRGMAAAVLGTDVDHIAAKLKQGHSFEKVTRKIPVYVAYFTAWPDLDGKVEYFGDVYDRDAKLRDAMSRTEAARAPSI
ncbi:murein L,D-transpeptidase YcbB/YkuD [Aminobacter niigataensis]|uniref:Murein L,D-transpeptidase YcbB/YkuD n=1 Tax=Aminobacter niigataensis TaxID=83265 RepID=A0ABR6KWX1_9HYPH|nr:murein L,D-transpeptidase [Aminobacter niigataensis]MBB4649025.1 murein L,D-transpeptidase YcbB/YkuD [Aminobacter niigataensis]